MAQLSYREAVKAAIAQEMRRDESVVFIGEDIAAPGGVFKTTEGLQAEFGNLRVRDTPISEQAIIGAVAGAAMTGLRPVAEIMFSDFFAVCWDIVANQIAKRLQNRQMSGVQLENVKDQITSLAAEWGIKVNILARNVDYNAIVSILAHVSLAK